MLGSFCKIFIFKPFWGPLRGVGGHNQFFETLCLIPHFLGILTKSKRSNHIRWFPFELNESIQVKVRQKLIVIPTSKNGPKMAENENFCDMTYTFVIYLWWIISRNSTMFTKDNSIFEHFWHQKGPKKWPEMKILQNDPKIRDPHPKNT